MVECGYSVAAIVARHAVPCCPRPPLNDGRLAARSFTTEIIAVLHEVERRDSELTARGLIGPLCGGYRDENVKPSHILLSMAMSPKLVDIGHAASAAMTHSHSFTFVPMCPAFAR